MVTGDGLRSGKAAKGRSFKSAMKKTGDVLASPFVGSYRFVVSIPEKAENAAESVCDAFGRLGARIDRGIDQTLDGFDRGMDKFDAAVDQVYSWSDRRMDAASAWADRRQQSVVSGYDKTVDALHGMKQGAVDLTRAASAFVGEKVDDTFYALGAPKRAVENAIANVAQAMEDRHVTHHFNTFQQVTGVVLFAAGASGMPVWKSPEEIAVLGVGLAVTGAWFLADGTLSKRRRTATAEREAHIATLREELRTANKIIRNLRSEPWM